MGHVSPEARRKWRRDTRRRRRDEWMKMNGPCRKCGGTDRLQVDHIDPKTKVSSDPWLWGKARREAELAKCQVLCTPCHNEKTLPNIQAAAQKRIGMKVDRHVQAELVQAICACCQKTFIKKAKIERFAAKHRLEGPFCSAVCRASACGKRNWKKRNARPEVQARRLKVIMLGRQGLPVVQIQQLLGGSRGVIKRFLLEDGQQIRPQGVH